MRVLIRGWLMPLFAFLLACQAAQPQTVVAFDFSESGHGWEGGFADYPVGAETQYELESDHRPLPPELSPGSALFITGWNQSDDLFMYFAKQVSGFEPLTTYDIIFEVEFASNATEGTFGIGGSPADSVAIKAGAVQDIPERNIDIYNYYRMAIDIGDQSQGGADARVLGTFGKPDDGTDDYVLVTRTNEREKPFRATADSSGSLWFLMGTDSGFEGTTSIYYTKFQASLTDANTADINIDGSVNAVDVQLVINEALGIDTGFKCDINNDGSVNAVDVQLVINAALGIPIPGSGETIMLPGNVPLEMAWAPAGTFMMGRYAGEQDSPEYEVPQHQVTLTQGFWMAKYELTKAQWQAVMASTPWSGRDQVLNDPNSPAVHISWNNAQAFITALNTLTGKTFRLPSEAEWEYACRAGTATRFYWGDDRSYTVGNDYAWWRYNSWDVDEKYAHVVGQKNPNTLGLCDMSGNVWEWCEDDWHASYTGAPATGAAWVDTPRVFYRVLRGGSWGRSGDQCRSAHRYSFDAAGTRSDIGFRVLRTP